MGEPPRDHWVPVAGGHQLHVRELVPTGESRRRTTVICIHGVFSDSRLFFSTHDPYRADGWFAGHGYRTFLGDLRGHGRSRMPAGIRRWNWDFGTYALTDIPALLTFAADRHDGPLFVLAHSFGGYVTLVALGLATDLQSRIAGVCAPAAAVNDYTDGGMVKRIQLPMASVLSRLVGRTPARSLRLGSSDEPWRLMRRFAQWARNGSFCSIDQAVDYWQTLGRVALPVYAGVGASDTFHASPHRARKLLDHLGSRDVTFEVFGRDQGFGHFDIAIGKRATESVLPRVSRSTSACRRVRTHCATRAWPAKRASSSRSRPTSRYTPRSWR